ncbi:branched-chain amino acid ABC transporter permease [Aerococcus sp. 1KP-2016]|jgi:branched-chain amino acid transport system permease protein|uniref:branched-chain amino acid ABC transporter permease n=1 Tax=Aerococcus sp. 1KP-2016 TaxID=1981982 RepID=UPI000B9973EA|nr:branched-chain amino acid ABC transporter permease [Aerococcus sp. 1KP-2016]OYQ67528.1 branched-chain amino acid ABC transporter permease [Aerococcus sp. 1KP-2016]
MMKKESWAKSFFTKPTLTWIAVILGVFFLIMAAYLLGLVTSFYQNILITIGINMILAVGLNLVVGYAGQFSLGHAGFMAIGAYVGAIVSMQIPGEGGFLLGMVAGAVLAAIVALIVGVPTLRLKGDYLAIATLGASEIIRIVIQNLEITNGAAGISGIPMNVTWITLYIFIVLTTLLVVNYIHSSPGRATIAVRENEIAAESVGVKTTKYKIIAFVIGAITASIAGSLYAGYFSVINPSQFTFQRSIDVLIIVVFGGIGSITGSFVAAIVLGLLNSVLAPLGQLRMVFYGIAIIAIMVFKPSGLMGEYELQFSKFFNRKKKKSDKEEA